MIILALSKSKLKCYIQCPKRYYFQYILKLKTKPSKALKRGMFIHEQCERFITHDLWKKFETEKFDFLERVKNSPGIDQALKNFVFMEHRRWEKSPKNYLPLHTEMRIFGKRFNGIIDRIDLDEKSEPVLVEIKTGKSYDDHISELYFYRNLVSEETDLGLVNKGKILLLDQNHVEHILFNNQKHKDLMWAVEKFIADIEDEIYVKKPSYLCKWCDFRERCMGNASV